MWYCSVGGENGDQKIYESFAEDLDIPLRDSSEYNLKYNELSRLIKQVSDKELAKSWRTECRS